MNTIALDPRLQNDCFVLGKLEVSHLLLMNNRLFPWLILVPETPAVELYELDSGTQRALWSEINRLSGLITTCFTVDKLNVAAIGNVVSQLHVHVIGRHVGDRCWPGVVWGSGQSSPYEPDERDRVIRLIVESLPTGTLRQGSGDLHGSAASGAPTEKRVR